MSLENVAVTTAGPARRATPVSAIRAAKSTEVASMACVFVTPVGTENFVHSVSGASFYSR